MPRSFTGAEPAAAPPGAQFSRASIHTETAAAPVESSAILLYYDSLRIVVALVGESPEVDTPTLTEME